MTPDIANYEGRMPAFVKHFFLSKYIERLTFKIASNCNEFVYIDGFSGPWMSATDNFEDTSFGIALQAMRAAKSTWKKLNGREVRMKALLVEKNAAAFAKLDAIKAKFPDIQIETFRGDFVDRVPTLIAAIPSGAFCFVLMDPKGYSIDMTAVAPLLSRPRTEVLFNFMFDFVNRASFHPDRLITGHLDALMPGSGWRDLLDAAVQGEDDLARPARRKAALVMAISETVKRVGNYPFVLETPVYYLLANRTFYSLIYATRSVVGLEVFRECQVSTLREQEDRRSIGKISVAAERSGQTEMFGSLLELAINPFEASIVAEKHAARETMLALIPKTPSHITFKDLWPQVLDAHIVTKANVRQIGAALLKEGSIKIPNWKPLARVPQDDAMLSLTPKS